MKKRGHVREQHLPPGLAEKGRAVGSLCAPIRLVNSGQHSAELPPGVVWCDMFASAGRDSRAWAAALAGTLRRGEVLRAPLAL